MNKLEIQREELCDKIYNSDKGLYLSVFDAFDAALALDLPIKFHKWTEQYRAQELARVHSIPEPAKKTAFIDLIKRMRDAVELYKYWIENVYEP